MSFPVYFDTCALYGISLGDLFLRLAENDAFRPLWSSHVLDELSRNLASRVGDAAAARRVDAMRTAFPEAEVVGYELLIDAMTNHPKDRHVLAAAVRAGAEVIVTFNLADFPAESTAPFDLTAVHPDEFLLNELDLHPRHVAQALGHQVAASHRPRLTLSDLLDRLSRCGVPSFAAACARLDC